MLLSDLYCEFVYVGLMLVLQQGKLLMVLIFGMLQCENVVLNNFLLKTQFNIVLLLALLDLVLHRRQLLTLLSVELAQLVK